MEIDYIPSTKYSQEQIDDAKIPYVLNDSCVDTLLDYRLCFQTSSFQWVPYYGPYYGKCKKLHEEWIDCQSNWEWELSKKREDDIRSKMF